MGAIKWRRVSLTFIFIIIGLLYYFITQWLNFSIPCFFRAVTGLLCPGCGITTACIALLEFRFLDAFTANLGLMLILPLVLFIICKKWYLWVCAKQDKKEKLTEWLTLSCVFFLIAWAFIRNIF